VKEGIELELSSSYTYKLNGEFKRAGQEVIDKALAIRLLTRLLEEL
jgi:hypothetical protein